MRVIPLFPMPSSRPREIFILAGQSNMSGRGLLSEVPTFPNASRVKVFSNAWVWEAGAEPVDSATGQIDTVSADIAAAASPSMSFGSSLAGLRPNIEVGLVPCAKGGSSLNDWQPAVSRTTLYGSMIARAKAAAVQGTIRGLLWYQGEAEAANLSDAETVKSRTEALIANIRADLMIPDLLVIVTVLGPNPNRDDLPYWSTVQAQQEAISGSGISVVSAADLTAKTGDEVHLTTGSLVTLGERYATAMHSLLGG